MLLWLYSCVRDDTGRRLQHASTFGRQWYIARPVDRAAVRGRLRGDPEFAVFGPHLRRLLICGVALAVVVAAGGWINEPPEVAFFVLLSLLVGLVVFIFWSMIPLLWRYDRRKGLLCGLCPGCGYDLRGNKAEVADITTCPECAARWHSRDIGLD